MYKEIIESTIQLLNYYLIEDRGTYFGDKTSEEKIFPMPGLIGTVEGVKFFIEAGQKSGKLTGEDANELLQKLEAAEKSLSWEVSMLMDGRRESVIAYKAAIKEKLFLNYTHDDEKI